jgi:hypothetical protein
MYKYLSLLVFVLASCSFNINGYKEDTTLNEYDHNFAVIADPHLNARDSNYAVRFNKIVSEINKNKDVKFIAILGDLATDKIGIDQAKIIMKNSLIPCIPIIGDNECQNSLKNYFFKELKVIYDNSCSKLNLKRQDNNNCNMVLEINDMTYIFVNDAINAEYGSINDSTEKWINENIEKASKKREIVDITNNVILFSHHPLSEYLTGYAMNKEDVNKIRKVKYKYYNTISSNICGHVHLTFKWDETRSLMAPLLNTYFLGACFDLSKDKDLLNVLGEYQKVFKIAEHFKYFDSKKIVSYNCTVSSNFKKLSNGDYIVRDSYIYNEKNERTGIGTDLENQNIQLDSIEYKEINCAVNELSIME